MKIFSFKSKLLDLSLTGGLKKKDYREIFVENGTANYGIASTRQKEKQES